MIDGRCEGKVLHFGACSVLKAEDEVLQQVCRDTGGKAVAGYTRSIDWVESAAFELLLVDRLARSVKMKTAYASIRGQYPDLSRKLGFRMAHATWASKRSIAVDAAEGT
jgi:hypothetical protein